MVSQLCMKSPIKGPISFCYNSPVSFCYNIIIIIVCPVLPFLTNPMLCLTAKEPEYWCRMDIWILKISGFQLGFCRALGFNGRQPGVPHQLNIKLKMTHWIYKMMNNEQKDSFQSSLQDMILCLYVIIPIFQVTITFISGKIGQMKCAGFREQMSAFC